MAHASAPQRHPMRVTSSGHQMTSKVGRCFKTAIHAQRTASRCSHSQARRRKVKGREDEQDTEGDPGSKTVALLTATPRLAGSDVPAHRTVSFCRWVPSSGGLTRWFLETGVKHAANELVHGSESLESLHHTSAPRQEELNNEHECPTRSVAKPQVGHTCKRPAECRSQIWPGLRSQA